MAGLSLGLGLLLGSGGGGGSSSSGFVALTADPNWKDVVYQQDFSRSIFDGSSKAYSVRNSGLSISSDALQFDGTHYLYVPDSADWTFSGDFCIDIWGVSLASIATDQVIASQYDATISQRSWTIGLSSANTTLYGGVSLTGSTVINAINTGYHITANTEYDLRLERSGSTLRTFINGSMIAKTTASGALFNSSSKLRIGATGNNGNQASIMSNGSYMKGIRITKAARHGADTNYTVESLPLGFVASTTVQLYSFDAGSRTEWFVDQSGVGSSSGIVFDVPPLFKYAGNPLSEPAGANTATWDRDKYYASTILDGSTYKVWTGDVSSAGSTTGIGYETSPNGRSFTKPTLNQVTYGGNTNNNLISGYDPTVIKDGSTFYILKGADSTGASNNQALIYSSADGITSLTLLNTITHASYCEFHGMGKRSDGKWLLYYTYNQSPADLRTIGAYLSDTTDPAGTWTDQGAILTPADHESQYYFINAQLINGVLYGLIGRYNSSTAKLWMDLATSTDGLTWTFRKSGLVPYGMGGDFDAGMAFGKNFTDDGSEIRLYYGGSVGNHAAAAPRDSRIGYAAVPSGRLGVVTGPSGTLTTTAFTPTADLKVNAKSSGGNLSVELLDATTGTPLTGYTKADCDNLDGDNTAKIVTWGGNPIPTTGDVKIKFYLDA